MVFDFFFVCVLFFVCLFLFFFGLLFHLISFVIFVFGLFVFLRALLFENSRQAKALIPEGAPMALLWRTIDIPGRGKILTEESHCHLHRAHPLLHPSPK